MAGTPQVVPLPSIGPSWLKPENASVLDPWYRAPIREVVKWLGLDDPERVIDPMSLAGGPLAVGGKMSGGAAQAIAKRFPRFAKALTAFHGSPHDFEKFDTAKIGTGEGAQVYGHGLYLAENEATARVYRDALGGDALVFPTGQKMKPPPGSVEDRALAYLATYSSPGQGIASPHRFARQEVQKLIDAGTGANRPGEIDTLRQISEKLREWETAGVTAGSGGRMYEVAIHADPDTMLDWDKPLARQSEKVRDAVAGSLAGFRQRVSVVPSQVKKGNWLIKVDDQVVGGSNTEEQAWKNAEQMIGDVSSPEFTGREAYYALARARSKAGAFPEIGVPNPAAASKDLRQRGVPGIKYLDQGSRDAGEGTRNFVIFDDSTIEILRKYGIMLPIAGGATAAASQPTGR